MRKVLAHPRVKKHLLQGSRFIIVGSLAAVIDLGSLTLLVEMLELDPQIAQIISTLLAVTFVFLANKFFTFRNQSKQVGSQLFKFALVYGIAIAANIGTTAVLIWLGVHYFLAKVAAIGLGVIWNYSMSHAFVFRVPNQPDQPSSSEIEV